VALWPADWGPAGDLPHAAADSPPGSARPFGVFPLSRILDNGELTKPRQRFLSHNANLAETVPGSARGHPDAALSKQGLLDGEKVIVELLAQRPLEELAR
jgi:hypothetical protein